MDAISQTTFWIAFSWMKMFGFRLKFHWSLFLRVQLTIFQHWFRKWLGAVQATSHYLNQWWLFYGCIYASLGLNELTQWNIIMHVYAHLQKYKIRNILHSLRCNDACICTYTNTKSKMSCTHWDIKCIHISTYINKKSEISLSHWDIKMHVYVHSVCWQFGVWDPGLESCIQQRK